MPIIVLSIGVAWYMFFSFIGGRPKIPPRAASTYSWIATLGFLVFAVMAVNFYVFKIYM